MVINIIAYLHPYRIVLSASWLFHAIFLRK